MARVGTPNLNIGMWLDGENPGAGSQAGDSTGLNGNSWKLDIAVGTEHNANGTHKTNIIDGAQLKTTVADGSTIVHTGAPLKLGVKDDGLDGIKLKASVVDDDSLEVSAATGTKVLRIKKVKAGKILGTGTGKAVDDVTINLNGANELQVKDASLGLSKLTAALADSQSYVLFATPQEAGNAVGNAVSNHLGYAETSLTNVLKVRSLFRKRAIDKYLKVNCRVRVSGGATWKVNANIFQILGGGTTVGGNLTGTNSAYSVTTEDCQFTVDISTLATDRIHACDIGLSIATGVGQADMIGVVLSIHGG